MGPCSAAEPTNNKVEVRERGWGGGVERHRLLVRCWQFHYWPQHHQDSGFPQLYAPDYSPALIRNLAAVTSSSAPLQFCRSSLFRNCIPVWFHSLEANQDKRMWQQQFDYYKGCKKKEVCLFTIWFLCNCLWWYLIDGFNYFTYFIYCICIWFDKRLAICTSMVNWFFSESWCCKMLFFSSLHIWLTLRTNAWVR